MESNWVVVGWELAMDVMYGSRGRVFWRRVRRSDWERGQLGALPYYCIEINNLQISLGRLIEDVQLREHVIVLIVIPRHHRIEIVYQTPEKVPGIRKAIGILSG